MSHGLTYQLHIQQSACAERDHDVHLFKGCSIANPSTYQLTHDQHASLAWLNPLSIHYFDVSFEPKWMGFHV